MLLITARSLIDGTGKVIRRPAILIDGERIVRVGTADEVGAPAGVRRLDLGDAVVLPGLIEAHCHLSRDGEPDFMVPMIREYVSLRALKAFAYARRDLMAGFTTVRAAGDIGYVDVALKQAVASGLVEGPRVLAAGKVLCATGGHRDGYFAPGVEFDGMAMIVDGAEAMRQAAREQIKRGADWVKLMATGGVVSPTEPSVQQMTYEEMKAACDETRRLGKRTAAHAHGAAGAKDAIRAGIHSIEHGKYLDEEAIQMLLEHNVFFVPTLCGAYNIITYGQEMGVAQSIIEKAKPGWESQLRVFARALECGVKIVSASDAGGTCVRHGECARELELLVKAGMTPMQAIVAATKTAAELLALDREIGTVEPGKVADIIAVGQDPLKDITALKNVEFVMQAGRVVKQHAKAADA